VPANIDLRVRFPVDDEQLSSLHARAFGSARSVTAPWAQRLQRHSLTWIGAFDRDHLVGFVHTCWDGGAHAFLLDTAVEPSRQHDGIGTCLVRALIDEATAAGCEWLHVDYEPHLSAFYAGACGFGSTSAGLRRLAPWK